METLTRFIVTAVLHIPDPQCPHAVMWQISIKDVPATSLLICLTLCFSPFFFSWTCSVHLDFSFYIDAVRWTLGGINSIDTFLSLSRSFFSTHQPRERQFLRYKAKFFQLKNQFRLQLSEEIKSYRAQSICIQQIMFKLWGRCGNMEEFERVWRFSVRWFNKRQRKKEKDSPIKGTVKVFFPCQSFCFLLQMKCMRYVNIWYDNWIILDSNFQSETKTSEVKLWNQRSLICYRSLCCSPFSCLNKHMSFHRHCCCIRAIAGGFENHDLNW